jgi:hypothetical protein
MKRHHGVRTAINRVRASRSSHIRVKLLPQLLSLIRCDVVFYVVLC